MRRGLRAQTLIAGVGMTPFARHPDRTLGSLAQQAADAALLDAGIDAADVGLVVFANAAAGVMSGQEMIRGQVALRGGRLHGVPVVNVENACASSATAVSIATWAIGAGQCEVALALGAERLTHEDRSRSAQALGGGIDLDRTEQLERALYGGGRTPSGSLFMDVYASLAREYSERSGARAADFAAVSVKNRRHSQHNADAQFRGLVTVEEVLASPTIVSPLTRLMCSPIGDGAAALVLCSQEYARVRRPRAGVAILASALVSGSDDAPASATERAGEQAYEQSGLGPAELDVVEVHDAAAPAELLAYEELGLCEPAGGCALLASGATSLGGRVPVNPSGGLLSRGHPVGATGAAQLVELVRQLRGECGERQVEGARIALAANAGGFLGPDHAAAVVTILAA